MITSISNLRYSYWGVKEGSLLITPIDELNSTVTNEFLYIIKICNGSYSFEYIHPDGGKRERSTGYANFEIYKDGLNLHNRLENENWVYEFVTNNYFEKHDLGNKFIYKASYNGELFYEGEEVIDGFEIGKLIVNFENSIYHKVINGKHSIAETPCRSLDKKSSMIQQLQQQNLELETEVKILKDKIKAAKRSLK